MDFKGVKIDCGDTFYVFHPQEDITSSELAHIVAYILCPLLLRGSTANPMKAMEHGNIKRHFEIVSEE